MDEGVLIRSTLLKTLTKVELYGHNDDNNRNIKDPIIIASWETSDEMFNLGCCE